MSPLSRRPAISTALLGCSVLVASSIIVLAGCVSSKTTRPATAAPASAAAVTATPVPLVVFSTNAPVPAGQTLTVTEIVKRVAPSVVQISTEAVQFDFFNRPSPFQGVGTGEVIDAHGNILTNNHVIEGARKITVTFRDGRSVTAKLVGADADTDLAIIHVDNPGVPPIALGNSASMEVGDDVVAIGQALGLPGGPTVTSGIISALDRSIDASADQTYRHLIQTDAAINPGNSGGPLLNRRGEMIGINSAKIQTGEGVGFAIAVDNALPIVQELLAKGRIERGYMGVSTVSITAALANARGLAVNSGIGLAAVGAGTPAANAGLRANDILTAANGIALTKASDLDDVLLKNRSGTKVSFDVARGTTKLKVEVTLGTRPTAPAK